MKEEKFTKPKLVALNKLKNKREKTKKQQWREARCVGTKISQPYACELKLNLNGDGVLSLSPTLMVKLWPEILVLALSTHFPFLCLYNSHQARDPQRRIHKTAHNLSFQHYLNSHTGMHRVLFLNISTQLANYFNNRKLKI